eukprot:6486219-Amphidinium_carterae.1
MLKVALVPPLGSHIHPSQFGFLRNRYIVQALGERERGVISTAAHHPHAAVLFCDLKNPFGSIHRGYLSNRVICNVHRTYTPALHAVFAAWLFVSGMNVHLLRVHSKLRVCEFQLSFDDFLAYDAAYLLTRVESLVERIGAIFSARTSTCCHWSYPEDC